MDEATMNDDATMTDDSTMGDDAAMADDSTSTEEAPVAEEAAAAPVSEDSITDPAGSDPNNTADQEFVEYVVKKIVEQPDEVAVERNVDEMGVLLTLKVAKDDMGKIIGKSGQTAKAIRILLRIIGSKNNARVNLKIVEPEGEML